MAQKTGAQRHIHKYRFNQRGQLWACGFGNCTHYLPLNLADMISDRMSICWKCGREMNMNAAQINMGRMGENPICDICIAIKEGKQTEANDNDLAKALAEVERGLSMDESKSDSNQIETTEAIDPLE